MSAAPSTPLAGAVEVASTALDHGLRTVAGVHRAAARKPFAVLRRVPALGAASALAQAIHDGVAGVVYAGLGGGLKLIGGTARIAAAVAGVEAEPRAGSLGDAALSALNGFAGDHLARFGNPLATAMSLRHGGRPLALRRAAFAAAHPTASTRVVLFVHGLACNETFWHAGGERPGRRPRVDYGARLERELGCTALYLRYNSGLPIADNGRQLSRLLEALVAEWPVPIAELVLVGHSMGGLVLRSAAHHGAGAGWTSRVRHAFYLGTPHRGAPLEKAANVAAWLLGRSEVTRPIAALLGGRSRGIKDLRFGALRDEDWGAGGVDALLDDRTADLPLLAGATHHFIAATVTRSRWHPLGFAIGDLLVRPNSAAGRIAHRGVPLARAHHLAATHHLALVDHPAVFDHLRQALARSTRA